MPFTVNVLLTCILNCDAWPGAAVVRIVCKYSRYILLVSYHGYHICPPTVIFGDAVALLQESYTLVQRNSHVFLALSDRAFVFGARCIGFFLL